MTLSGGDYPAAVAESVKNQSSGIPVIVWVLSGIILFLIIVILVRDRGIRKKIGSVFRFIGKKYRISRLNTKIEKLQEKVKERVTDIGEKTWKKGLLKERGRNIHRLIDEIMDSVKDLEKRMEAVNKELKINRDSHDDLIKSKKGEIEDLERKRGPFDEKSEKKSNRISDLKKSEKSFEKRMEKLKRGIERNRKNLTKLKNDILLDDEEREFRVKKAQTELDTFIPELSQVEKDLEKVRLEVEKLTEENSLLETEIERYNKMIKVIEDEMKKAEEENGETVKELLKKKGEIASLLSQEKRKLRTNFFLLGDLADKLRPKDNSLSLLFREIDEKREVLKNLKREKESIQ